jgi:hypothetical protein
MEGCAMLLSILRWILLIGLLCIGASGCSYFQGATNDDDIELTESDEEVKLDSGELTRTPMVQGAVVRSPVTATPVHAPKLRIGDRFPFSKSVEHRLTQIDKSGTQVSSSRTDISLVIVVDKVLADGRKLMSVQFQRVQHVQDILGKRIAYTSDDPNSVVPQEIMLYAGLIGNGFSFWVGPNNKTSEVVGYGDFIRRCVRGIPDSSKAAVQQQFDPTKGIEGIANFIDDSIGLLPLSDDPKQSGAAISKDAFWELEPRYCDMPVPVVTNTRCILKEVSANAVEVLMTGRISGVQDPFVLHEVEGDLKVFVKGGSCTGACTINPQTGLPSKSQIQRSLDLVLELPDGQRILQNKDTVTNLSLEMDPSPMRSSSSDLLIQQTGSQNGVGNPRTVVPSGFSRQNQ